MFELVEVENLTSLGIRLKLLATEEATIEEIEYLWIKINSLSLQQFSSHHLTAILCRPLKTYLCENLCTLLSPSQHYDSSRSRILWAFFSAQKLFTRFIPELVFWLVSCSCILIDGWWVLNLSLLIAFLVIFFITWKRSDSIVPSFFDFANCVVPALIRLKFFSLKEEGSARILTWCCLKSYSAYWLINYGLFLRNCLLTLLLSLICNFSIEDFYH